MASNKPSLRYIAKELEISPAYLSYMLSGKQPWRKDLYQRYAGVVNTCVNSDGQNGNKAAKEATHANGLFSRNLKVGGSARESNPPTPLVTRHNGFEVRKGHRAPSTPSID